MTARSRLVDQGANVFGHEIGEKVQLRLPNPLSVIYKVAWTQAGQRFFWTYEALRQYAVTTPISWLSGEVAPAVRCS